MVPSFQPDLQIASGKVALQLKNVENASEEEIRQFLYLPNSFIQCRYYDNSWFVQFENSTQSRQALESIKGRVLKECKPHPKLLTLKQLPPVVLSMLRQSPNTETHVCDQPPHQVPGEVAIMQRRKLRHPVSTSSSS
eukprot:TRINITY_DN11807_c0_g1_i1.p1 TRINITY_DN11807_c0_g1~~TRINITY_DN11807_c0_g1_i1.p1  ORF type:complete len:150 (-),score=15.23 TRINITY_DN11807_c0_g1_i1:350-760(-)